MQPTDLNQLRVCKKCDESKPLHEFVKTKACKFGRSHTCRLCNWKYLKPIYEKNRKQRAVSENIKNRSRKKSLVDSFGNKCFDCGNSYPACVYDFHHLNPAEKDYKPSTLRKIELIESELSKCVMLCSNCHRIRHWVPRKDGTA